MLNIPDNDPSAEALLKYGGSRSTTLEYFKRTSQLSILRQRKNNKSPSFNLDLHAPK